MRTHHGTVQEDRVSTRRRDNQLDTFYSLSAFSVSLPRVPVWKDEADIPCWVQQPSLSLLTQDQQGKLATSVSSPLCPSEPGSLHFLLHFPELSSAPPNPLIPVKPWTSGPYSSFLPPLIQCLRPPPNCDTAPFPGT